MKNTRAVAMLIVSIVLGLAVSALAVGWVAQKGTIASNKVVVAVMDIELGSRLNPQMLTTVDWPRGSLPQGAFADVKELQDRVVKTSIQRGEAILIAKLAPVGTQGGLSAVITEGKRAMTVRVNDVVGVAGFALPGNYVDVMVNAQKDKEGAKSNEEQQQISKTVLERVLVLAVAQEASRDETKPKVVNAVTLEVTPSQAENLDLARSVGTLSLVLRNQVETQLGETEGATKATLLGEDHAAPPLVVAAASAPAPVKRAVRRVQPVAAAPVVALQSATCVEVIRGTVRSNECF